MKRKAPDHPPVAIIGIGCIFAQSPDLKSYFGLLTRGINGISDPPPSHSHLCDYFDPDPKKPDHIYCNRGGYLPQIDFDPTEFGIPPNSLEATDTSQLLGLLTAKRAIEDAGYGDGGKTFDRTKASVILGVTGTQELVIPLGARLGHPLWRRALEQAGVPRDQADEVIDRIGAGYVDWQESSFPGLLGNVVAGRIANRLDFGGTNCVVDAACASSMGAIHLALLELYSNRSDMVVTGGVDTINDAFMHMCFAKTHLLSPSGDIRPFSKDADGTVLGEGVGLMVLKRLAEAERDGDRIYAVIRGIGSASDGKAQSIYAPRQSGQANALKRAYECARIDPTTIGLVEAHGTGTSVGDQVEFKALCEIFGAASPNGNGCALGSVKSNIGHTKAAAGTAGLIKAALSIYHKILPPTLKAERINPDLGIDHSPFYLNQRLRPWMSPNGQSRKAGVSSFGFGGSNFHAVLEEHAPQKPEIAWDGTIEIAAFSGSSQRDLVNRIEQWLTSVEKKQTRHHIGKSSLQSRLHFNVADAHRAVMVFNLNPEGTSVADVCRDALALLAGKPSTRHDGIFYAHGPKPGRLAFLFPGQGSQYVGMGRDLICTFPECMASFQDAAKHLDQAQSLDDYLYPRTSAGGDADEQQLRNTRIAQPAIGAVSVAMLDALAYFGVTPDVTCGHSYGELVALYAAGWITKSDLWQLSAARGRLMAEAGSAVESDPGTMLAVKAPLEAIERMVQSLDASLVLANRNSPGQGVVSGPRACVEAVADACRDRGWPAIQLPVAAAFHSNRVADAQHPFAEHIRRTTITPTPIDVMSNTRGDSYPRNVDGIQAILGAQLALPVDFVGNIETLYAQGTRTFIEIGPKQTLTHLVSAILEDREFHALALDRSAGRDAGLYDLAIALSQLAALGYDVELKHWEKPAAPLRRARMMVPLSGANYRGRKTETAQPQRASGNGRHPTGNHHQPASPETDAVHPPEVQRIAKTAPPAPYPPEPVRDTMDPNTTQSLQNALAAARKGLESLQALQAQTTQAHQKYLETQAEASRTLKQLISSTQQLASAALGVSPPPEETVIRQPDRSAETAKNHSASVPQRRDDPAPAALAAAQPSEHQAPALPVGSSDGAPSELACTLLSIVSELTGYPEPMLGMEMDIESDLGIDSIKRVEILSALEHQMPHLPQVTPDMMGTLKTLGQICDYLAGPQASPSRPPAAASAATTSAPAGEVSAPSDLSEVRRILLSIVSELTGYPEPMLGMEMDIESDLGIDSIKRVEILSALEHQMPHLPQVTPDMMGTLKTLGQICDYLAGNVSAGVAEAGATASVGIYDPEPVEAPDRPIVRKQVRISELPLSRNHSWKTPPDGFIGVAGSNAALIDALIQALATHAIVGRHIDSPDALRSQQGLAGMILTAPMEPLAAFEWARQASTFEATPPSDGALFCTVSFLDGAFGFFNSPVEDPLQGALSGLAKTAAIEWPSVRCLALDIDPGWSPIDAVAQAIAREAAYPQKDGAVEIGLSASRRVGLELIDRPLAQTVPIDLAHQDVVVATGGARGVTAMGMQALSAKTGCRLALLGRTPIEPAEPDWLADLSEPGEIKAAIVSHHFAGQTPTPVQVETLYQSLLAARQIRQTLKQLSGQGHSVRYYGVDVRDPRRVAATFKQIRKELGGIKAIVHGAGVLADRLITDKETTQFQRVFETKVAGLRSLLEAADGDELRYLILFSSVSARLGNVGQSDYAMANEVLNKMARQHHHRHPDCKVVSINWGPWDGGMVTPGLKAAFEAKGVGLIPPAAGAEAMVNEMTNADSDAIEVVIGSIFEHARPEVAAPATTAGAAPGARSEMTTTATRTLNVDGHPVLDAHRLDGRPVVPLAIMAEWLAHSALHANPGLKLYGLDQLRLLNGIVLKDRDTSIRILAGRARRDRSRYEVDVEIRNLSDLAHVTAKAILVENHPAAPRFTAPDGLDGESNGVALKDVYDQILFHGKPLHGLQRIAHVSDQSMTARIASAPPPAQWMNEPLRSRWIADPLVIDSAFQMAIVWCYHQRGQVSLPGYAESYRQYRERFPASGVSAVMQVQKCTRQKLISDFTFLDEESNVVATLNGYQAVMTPTLMRAFKAA